MGKTAKQVKIIRERGRQQRLTRTHAATKKVKVELPAQEQSATRGRIHKTDESIRFQRENLPNRLAFRRGVTEESLRRGRIQRGELRNERYVRDIGDKTGARSGSIGILAGIIRVFVVIFALSALFLLVSRGAAAGDAIQKVGYFLTNVTSSQPLFKQKAS